MSTHKICFRVQISTVSILFIPRHTIVAGCYGFMSFPDENLSKCQWNFTKFGMCIDIVEICFGFANGQISSIFDRVVCPRHVHIFVSERKLVYTSVYFHETWHVH